MKIALLAPGLLNYGGQEKVILTHARHFQADIYVGLYTPETTFPELKQYVKQVLCPHTHKIPRLRTLLNRKAFDKLRLEGYDAYIIYGGHALPFAKHHKQTVWYCTSPQRWLYDLYPEEMQTKPLMIKPLFWAFCKWLRKQDRACAKAVGQIVYISEYVRKKGLRYYGRDGMIVNPPVDVHRYKYLSTGNYFLSNARVDPIKRVAMIVEAFQELPEHRLKVVSTGPDLEKVKALAKDHPNIEILGRVSDDVLEQVIGNCIATITMSYKEDFSMVTLEAQSAGKPTIAVNDGAFPEIVTPNKTGFLIEGTIKALQSAVKIMTQDKAKKMRKACEDGAKRFSEEKHIQGIRKALEQVMKRAKK